MPDREPLDDPTPDELLRDLTDLFNDLQMAVAPKSYSQALLHCIAAMRAASLGAEAMAGQPGRRGRWPMADRVVPFNAPLTYGRALR